MSASTKFAKTVVVELQYNATCGLFSLTSAGLPGLFLAGKDPGKLVEDLPAVIKAIYKVGYDMQVEVVTEGLPQVPSHNEFMLLPSSTLLKVEPLHA
jgi:hypothetical protein